MCGCGFAEIPIGPVVVDIQQVRSVENIEELKPDLEVNPFCNVSVLVEVDVRFGKIRLAELSHFLVTLGAESWNREITGRDRAVQKCSTGRCLLVSYCIGV